MASADDFWIAAMKGDVKTVKQYIDAGKDINAQDEYGVTGLMLAADRGEQDILELLIRHKANIDVETINGYTGLILAAIKGHQGTVKLLIRHKANIDVETINKRMTARDYAVEKGHSEIVELIDQAKAQIIEEKKNNACRREYGRAFALASRVTKSSNSENITMSDMQKRLPPGYRDLIDFFSHNPGLVKWTGASLLLYFTAVT